MDFTQSKRWHRSLGALIVAAGLGFAGLAPASVFISVGVAPPPLPVYEQPVVPGPGYIWVPGYWAWGVDDYYWVPGSWELPPGEALLWTPGYWAFDDGFYRWHTGYWGPHVGFYGGISYGYGYPGYGYEGGYWRDHAFFYNRAVNNVNVVNVHNTYVQNVTQVNVTHVSYNGGNGGINAAPRPDEREAEREHHFDATQAQLTHEQQHAQEHGISPEHWRPQQALAERGLAHGDGPQALGPGVSQPAGKVEAATVVNNSASARAAPPPNDHANVGHVVGDHGNPPDAVAMNRHARARGFAQPANTPNPQAGAAPRAMPQRPMMPPGARAFPGNPGMEGHPGHPGDGPHPPAGHGGGGHPHEEHHG